MLKTISKIQKNLKRMIVKISNKTSMETKSRQTKLETNEHMTKHNQAKEPNKDIKNKAPLVKEITTRLTTT